MEKKSMYHFVISVPFGGKMYGCFVCYLETRTVFKLEIVSENLLVIHLCWYIYVTEISDILYFVFANLWFYAI